MVTKINKLIKRIFKINSLQLLLSVAVASIIALWQGFLPASQILLLSATMLIQWLLVFYLPFESKMLPIKLLSYNDKLSKNYSGFSPWLSILPFVASLNVMLGWLIVFCIYFLLIPLYFRVFLKWRNCSSVINLLELKKYNALIAIHVSVGKSKSAYQINQWLMVLEKLSVPVVIILREQAVFNQMYATSLPVIYARNIEHVEQVFSTGVRTVLYPANGQKNAAVLRAYKLNHFFINHGESDKAVNQSKFLMAYDKLLVSGPLAERRLLQHGLPLRPNQVVQVGRPQAELVLDRGERGAPLRTILYAPTWEGFMDSVNYSSIGSFSLKQLTELFSTNKYKVLFKPHPFTGRRFSELQQEVIRIKALCEQYGHEYIGPEESVLELMNRSDLLVSDISSVLNDYLATGKPLVLCVTDKLAEHDILTDFPSSKAAYLLNENGSENVLDLLHTISTLDVMADQREAVRADSLGDFEQGSFARFNEVVTSSVQN